VNRFPEGREGVQAICRSFETSLLPCLPRVLAHRSGDAPAADPQAIIAQLMHARAAVSPVRQGKGRADMHQQHHVVALPAQAGRSFQAK
jgi:hypothetical protein